MANEAPLHQLHSLLSLAEISRALSTTPLPPPTNAPCDGLSIRLPLLLRHLSASQSATPVDAYFPPREEERGAPSSRPWNDALDAERAVPPLEDAAASRPGAENIEILVSSLAPSICRDVAGLPPPKRGEASKRSVWNAEALEGAAERLDGGGGSKRGGEEERRRGKRRRAEGGGAPAGSGDATTDDSDEDLVPRESVDGERETERDVASNDSCESAARRALRELLALVASSLRSESEETPDGAADAFRKETGFASPGIAMRSESLFAESNAAGFGGGRLSLSAMVVSLLYHASVLRYDHVAAALCRAAAPQTPQLVQHMAANCPAAVPSLLRGIVAAHKLATEYNLLEPAASGISTEDADLSTSAGPEPADILATCERSIGSIASLSSSEAHVVICALKEHEVMDDLVLELLMDRDAVGGALFVVEKLSADSVCDEEEPSSEMPAVESKPRYPSRQSTISDSAKTSSDGAIAGGAEEQHASRQLSLRQRMISRRFRSDDSVSKTRRTVASPKNAKSPQIPRRSNLVGALSKNSSLAERCVRRISSRIAASIDSKQTASNTDTVCFGEVAILLRAFALLVRRARMSNSDCAIQIIGDITNLLKLEVDIAEMPDYSLKDDVYKLALCAAIIAWSKCLPAKDSTDSRITTNETMSKVCQECIRSLLLQSTSLECTVFASRVCGFVVSGDAEGAKSMVLDQLYPHNMSVRGEALDFELQQISHIMNGILSSIDKEQLELVHKAALAPNAIMHSPVVAIDVIRKSAMPSNDLDDLIKNLLSDPKSCHTLSCKPMACEFLQESVDMVSRRAGPRIPVVLPFSLERVAISIPWSSIDTANFHERFSQFVMQLVYALLFLEKEPTSPFAINPRIFPLKETLRFAGSDSFGGHTAVCALLEQLMSKHCPDLVSSVKSARLLNCGVFDITSHESITPSLVYQAIRDCLDAQSSMDQSGLRAEKLYLMSSPHHLTSELDVAVVSAVLPSRHSQTKFISYLALCRDPLVILKARAPVWNRHGIRRLLLRVLHNIMDANESIVLKCCDNSQVALEFLASRDSIIARCLLFAQAKLCSEHCVLSVNMIRSLISRRPGTVATLLKQGLDDGLVDYLVKFVPESFSDAMILSSLLSEKGLFSASERLTVADASLRIAIAHCSRGEMIAKGLVSVSLIVLVESFHLVLGPTGVPVSVLRQVNGQDVTDICRNALFRMISNLSTIDPNSVLKDCAVPSIGKISSMCKSESASVGGSGVAAARRKALLKEIWEACVFANNALGGKIQI